MNRYTLWRRVLPLLFLPVYGSGYIAGALGLEAMRPFAMTFWRFAIAGVVVLVVAVATRARWPRGRQWWPVIAVGVLLQVVQFGGNYTAMGLGMPAGLASLIAGSSSLMIAVGAVPLLRERLGGWRLAGVLLGFAGVAVALADHLGAPSGPAGVLASLSAAIGYAGGSLLQRRFLAGVDPWASVSVQFLVAAPITLVLAELTGGVGVPLTASALLPLAWIALVNSVVGMWLLGQMLRVHAAATLSAWSNLIPAFTALLAIPFLGQRMTAGLVIGLAISLAGTALVVLPAPRLRRRGSVVRALAAEAVEGMAAQEPAPERAEASDQRGRDATPDAA